MKYLLTLFMIFILLFTPNCQKDKDPNFLGVPGGGKDGVTKAYTLFMILSLYGGLPNCPTITGTIQVNVPVTDTRQNNFSAHLQVNDKLVLKNTSSSEKNKVVLNFSLCDSFGYRIYGPLNIECLDSLGVSLGGGLVVKSQEEGYCIVKSNYNFAILQIYPNEDGNANSYILEVRR